MTEPLRLRVLVWPTTQLGRGLAEAAHRGPTEAQLTALRMGLAGVLGAAVLPATAATATAATATATVAAPGTAGGGVGMSGAASAGAAAVPVAKGAAAATAFGAWVTAVGKVSVAVTLLATASVGGYRVVSGPRRTPASKPSMLMLHGESPSSVVAGDAPAPANARLSAPDTVPPPPAAPAAPSPARPSLTASRRPAVVSAPGAEEREELSLLSQAQALLEAEPAGALRLVRAHEARFPLSAFAEEREVILINALRATGESAQAIERETSFRRLHPGSPYFHDSKGKM